ncbi:ATPase [Photobacterium sp. 1_MG-2023]|uniref:Dph6-related ATP pyrophosphatase n=1 Tax=Photobacterium sp. 1_MG-2023 TaxID=3062646 RepID=UPI0026E16BBC|nr:ATPase [Photobacterium sp. 1_MG-2023]MDO6707495.1 adenine nucleotide alpha hydrolase [Photobacterium sp. 1_MG-2023]
MKPKKVIVSWSSGKDATLTLLRLLENPDYEVAGLYTTYVRDEVPFQATPMAVVRAQARLTGFPLIEIALPEVFPPNAVYQARVVGGIRQQMPDVEAVAFGDMFCNGIEAYRRRYIEPAGWSCVFPLLGEDSRQLAQEILDRGIQTILTTIDTSQLSGDYCGRWFDAELLRQLPHTVDPCGENGEFHTLVVSAPCFQGSLQLRPTGIERQERFHCLRYQIFTSD